MSFRQVLALRNMLSEVSKIVHPGCDSRPVIRCRVFEDNNGAIALATTQRITDRTKYFHVKWHFFWDHVKNGDVTVEKIDTKEQIADFLTKGLVREVFEKLRAKALGW